MQVGVNTFRRIPVTLVLVDAGPLISLAACDRLDLLDSFDKKVRVVDVVKAECLRHPDKIGGAALSAWFGKLDGHRYGIEPTPLLDDWLEAEAQEAAGDVTKPTQQIGDAAVALAVRRFSLPASSPEVILLLLDDSRFGDGLIRLRNPELYALSTRAFLKTLENFGRIPSAMDVLRSIIAAGRNPSPYNVDRPGRIGAGTKSEWTSALDGAHQSSGGTDKAIRRVLAEIVVNHAKKAGLSLPSDDIVDLLVMYASEEQLRQMVEEMGDMTDLSEFVKSYNVSIPGYGG